MSDTSNSDAGGIRIVIVDDHELVRSGVRGALDPDIDVVAEAEDVDQALEALATHRPQVVLLDVHLPGGNGAAVIRGAAARDIETTFLDLSASDVAEDVIEVIRADARGYITKTISSLDLNDAIRRVAEGDAVFSPRLAGFVLDAFAGAIEAPDDPELDQLTKREQEVLRLLARGYAYKEIGCRLTISVKTVETHASAVLRKLQLSNRHELTDWAHRRRLI
ncbi:MAG: response regulator transcription factor [Actinomycetota bacterium]|nr:response regulator transcription factor [Actinomycetota bacterium]